MELAFKMGGEELRFPGTAEVRNFGEMICSFLVPLQALLFRCRDAWQVRPKQP